MKKLRNIAVAAALAVSAVIGFAGSASAHSGSVTASETCQGWSVSVDLAHNVTSDRSVDVVSTVPGVAGFTGHHYDTTYGNILSASGPETNLSGTVTLNIYKPAILDTWVSNSPPDNGHNLVSHTNDTSDIHDDYWTREHGPQTHFPKYTFVPGSPAALEFSASDSIEPARGCETDTTATEPTFIDPTCTSGADIIIPNTEGVDYAYDTADVAPGETVTVTATAQEGYVLTGDKVFTHTYLDTPTQGEGCPTPPPPVEKLAFIFSDCNDTFVRFTGANMGDILNISIDGVEQVGLTYQGVDVDLGQLPNGTVVTAAVQGSEVRTLTVDNEGCTTAPPTVPPTPPTHTPWTPQPPIPTHAAVPGSGDLAFTGADITAPLIFIGVFLSLAALSFLMLRRKFRV